MPRQDRGYKRAKPFRDARLFVIVCEGEREKKYFEFFQQFSQRVKFRLLPPIEDKSAPNHSLDRAASNEEELGLTKDDQLWFVSDTDRWEENTLRTINEECMRHSNWSLAISNPCFEVWLFLHQQNISATQAHSPKDFKRALDVLMPSGYQVAIFAPLIEEATQRARNDDSQPHHFLPERRTTKLYLLAEQLRDFMGQEWSKIARKQPS